MIICADARHIPLADESVQCVYPGLNLKAPFPWFGGKSRCADIVWERFGDVPNYVEPFAGSLAVLLARPHEPGTETVNDLDGYVANFWRAVTYAPEQTAEYADWPVNENDLHARHYWLVQQAETLRARLEGDPDFYDAKIAGWWVWGICSWIGGGFCSGKGPWHVNSDRQLVHLGSAGRGVNRQLPSLEGHTNRAVHKPSAAHGGIYEWFTHLSDRLRRVRVCSGDWSRVCGPAVTFTHGITGVFLDPPYADTAERDSHLYREDSLTVAHAVREWALANGSNPLLRIALCGYEGEHTMPADWECAAWKATGGYGSQRQDGSNDNGAKERIWFSPHCLKSVQQVMF